MSKEEIIKEVIAILETSDYVDSSEHLYDGIKQIKREITYSTIHDFLWALESPTVLDVDGKVTLCAKKIKPLLADMTIDEAYENYSKEYVKDNSIGMCLLIARMDGKSTYRKPNKEMFIDLCTHDKTFSERWGLKIEERELSLEERYGLSRVNGISPKYSFEIEDGKPTPNKMSESEWYDNHNIPTKLIKVTYNDTKLESYE